MSHIIFFDSSVYIFSTSWHFGKDEPICTWQEINYNTAAHLWSQIQIVMLQKLTGSVNDKEIILVKLAYISKHFGKLSRENGNT